MPEAANSHLPATTAPSRAVDLRAPAAQGEPGPTTTIAENHHQPTAPSMHPTDTPPRLTNAPHIMVDFRTISRRGAAHEIRGPGGSLTLRPDDEAALDLVMLIDGETSGRHLEDVLQQYGRSRSTYYEKLRRFREDGLEGLLARPPGPRNAWRRPLEVVRFIVTTRLVHPDRSAPKIAQDLSELGHVVSVRSVERTLTQFGLTRTNSRASIARGSTNCQGRS